MDSRAATSSPSTGTPLTSTWRPATTTDLARFRGAVDHRRRRATPCRCSPIWTNSNGWALRAYFPSSRSTRRPADGAPIERPHQGWRASRRNAQRQRRRRAPPAPTAAMTRRDAGAIAVARSAASPATPSRKERKPTESHHIGGEANSPISVEVPITDHRMLSDAQYEWPPGAAAEPGWQARCWPLAGLLQRCGRLRRRADCQRHSLHRNFLRKLDTWLREQCRPLWWKGTDFDGWQPA